MSAQCLEMLKWAVFPVSLQKSAFSLQYVIQHSFSQDTLSYPSQHVLSSPHGFVPHRLKYL